MTKIIFTIAILAIVYLIIFYSLRIMYKDIKGSGRKTTVKTFGLEVVAPGDNTNLKTGTVLPINREITLGRKEDNILVLKDQYVSSYHAKIYYRNREYYLEDLNSTNGTLLNGEKIKEKITLEAGDEIEVGSSVFRVI